MISECSGKRKKSSKILITTSLPSSVLLTFGILLTSFTNCMKTFVNSALFFYCRKTFNCFNSKEIAKHFFRPKVIEIY